MSPSMMLHRLVRSSYFIRNSNLIQKTLPQIHIVSTRKKSDTANGSDLSSSTILIQDGLTMQELPVIVRKVKNIMSPFDNKADYVNTKYSKFTEAESDVHQMINNEFNRCIIIEDVYGLLSKCSRITPNIALGAMERIYNIVDEALKTSKNIEPIVHVEILDKLSNMIVRNDDIYALLRALNVVAIRSEIYLSKFSEEILKRITDNKLSVLQVCDVISFFGKRQHIEEFGSNIEKLWVGLAGKEKELDEKSFVKCFNILIHLKTSQKFVLGILEKRLFTLWWQMKPDSIVEVMNGLIANNITITRILPILGRWLNTNIHVLNDENLLDIVSKLTLLNYTDPQVERALERFIKVKGLKVELHALMVSIMKHCTHFRIRNTHILNGCAEYFIVNGKQLSPMFVKPLLFPFGYLNFQPNNALKFWETVETVLEEKFIKLNVEDVLDIMLSCVYLEKYPINFVSKIFNPHFLQRINSMSNNNALRNKLKLLDVAMTLECKAYNGPILPKDHSSKSYFNDSRIRRLVNGMKDSFEHVAGGADYLSTFVLLPNIYATDLYIVDVMIHPKNLRDSILTLNLNKDRNINVAILINVPEHFSANGDVLLGPQKMRVKHMRIMGLKVVNLKFDILSRLRIHRKELHNYLVENFKRAQPAI